MAESYKNFNPGPAIVHAPDMQKRALPEPAHRRAVQGRLHASALLRDVGNMWRFGQYPDVVVGFDRLPVKYVFWRGVSYIPMIVNEKNQWYCNEFNETGGRRRAGRQRTHVRQRLLEFPCPDHREYAGAGGRPLAVLAVNPEHHWANYDAATGWGDIADWYYYIYPDGVAAKRMRC